MACCFSDLMELLYCFVLIMKNKAQLNITTRKSNNKEITISFEHQTKQRESTESLPRLCCPSPSEVRTLVQVLTPAPGRAARGTAAIGI